jgi:O-6-methylguanine DNA methyltransferase
MNLYSTEFKSPVGRLRLVQENGALIALYADSQKEFHTPCLGTEHPATFKQAFEQLNAYFNKQLKRFSMPFELKGTAFQRAVWQAMNQIPYGSTQSYAELAIAIQQPTAYRAVAQAVGQNPLLILQPCHRVVGKNGHLTGFSAGLPMKEYLLMLEKGD